MNGIDFYGEKDGRDEIHRRLAPRPLSYFIPIILFDVPSQSLLEFGVSLLHGEILDGIAQRLDLSDEHANLLGPRNGSVDEIAL